MKQPAPTVREQDGAPPTELTPRIGRVASRELALRGYVTYERLTHARERDLLAIHGVGPKAIRILREELAARQLAFVPGPNGTSR
jgi:predicted flap endonuclease-1-like 5' DNA nuclease